MDKLHQLQAAFTPRANATILLDTHLKDDDYAITLRQILLDQFNIKSYINQGEDNPGGNVAILEARLRQGRMIIIFGQVAESWVLVGWLTLRRSPQRKYSAPLWDLLYGPAPAAMTVSSGSARCRSMSLTTPTCAIHRHWRPLLASI